MFELTVDMEVGAQEERLPDGMYTGTITDLVTSSKSNPYFVVALRDDMHQVFREERIFINSQISWEIMSRDINNQLGLTKKDVKDMNYREWFDTNVKNAEINFWLTTSEPYQNASFKEPANNEEIQNGAL